MTTTAQRAIPLGDGTHTPNQTDQTDTHPIVSAADDPRDLREEDSHDMRATYLPEQAGSQASERWQRIQTEFVDDPRKSVSEAHELVSELMQRIVDTFTNEKNDLEQQWSKGGSVSTEDMRVCLQRYRSFFTRLLPLGEKPVEDR